MCLKLTNGYFSIHFRDVNKRFILDFCGHNSAFDNYQLLMVVILFVGHYDLCFMVQ